LVSGRTSSIWPFKRCGAGSQAVKRLLDLQPETARVEPGTQELEVPIEDVKVGDLVRIRPGERIPADGHCSLIARRLASLCIGRCAGHAPNRVR
jgi:E1-E2 ATPase